MGRQAMNRKVDNRVFKRTAACTKKINLQQVSMRGGIKL